MDLVAEGINAHLSCVYLWGRPWNINFKPITCFHCVVVIIIPLFMAFLSIEEVESLKILGFHFDKKLTWNTMVSQLSLAILVAASLW